MTNGLTRFSPFRCFLVGMLSALLAIPTPLMAQGFEFDEEETAPVTEVAEEEAEDDGEGMTFTSDDLSKEDAVEEKIPNVAIVAVPGANMDPERRAEVQAKMMEVAKNYGAIVAVGPEAILPGLQDRGVDDCVTDPLCLGSVGDEASVDRIVVGRVRESVDGLEFGVDYFDVGDRLFIAYDTKKGVSSTSDVVDAVEPAMRNIFGIKDASKDPNYVGTEDSSIVQDIVAYGAAGLAVASLGAGIYFGLDASSKEDELASGAKTGGGAYVLTQQEANEKVREAESSATTANIFYGLAAALTVTSVVFFIIKGGSDVGEERASKDLIQDLQLAPIFSESGAGFGASFSF